MTDAQHLVPAAARPDTDEESPELFITLPARDGEENEVQIPQRPIYDALTQLSLTLCNGDGWSSDMPAIAWGRLALGVDRYESYTYSTYEEVLVDLYAVVALCVPHGWWPVEIHDPTRLWPPTLDAWTFDDWNAQQREHGYPVIDDPVAALKALGDLIRNNPKAIKQYEQKRANGSWPHAAASPIS